MKEVRIKKFGSNQAYRGCSSATKEGRPETGGQGGGAEGG